MDAIPDIVPLLEVYDATLLKPAVIQVIHSIIPIIQSSDWLVIPSVLASIKLLMALVDRCEWSVGYADEYIWDTHSSLEYAYHLWSERDIILNNYVQPQRLPEESDDDYQCRVARSIIDRDEHIRLRYLSLNGITELLTL
jgi:hypothetical protein